jgi:site-specific recombinase XerD
MHPTVPDQKIVNLVDKDERLQWRLLRAQVLHQVYGLVEAGLQNFTWYCLRHTFASRLVMRGVDLRTVAELMGHRTIQMTMRYAHLSPNHTLAAVRRMDEMFGSTATSTATGDFKGAESNSGRIN